MEAEAEQYWAEPERQLGQTPPGRPAA
jgi:hypothetical protein